MLISGSAAHLKQRDEYLITDLYLVRYLTARQIAAMYFLVEDSGGSRTKPSPGAADRRMYRLATQGWVTNYPELRSPAGNNYKLWALSEQAFEREREAFGDSPQRHMPPGPKIGRLDHLVRVNDLYLSCSYALRFLVGEPDIDGSETWTWRYEGKHHREITIAGEGQTLRPDAEIKIGDILFFVEHQTRESRVTVEKMEEKATNYARYVEHVLRVPPEKARLLVVTDEERIVQRTTTRAQQEGLIATAGDAEHVTEYLISHVQGI